MRTDLPSRIDSGIRLTDSGDVHRNGGQFTVCGQLIGKNARAISDNRIRTSRLSTCRRCWRLADIP